MSRPVVMRSHPARLSPHRCELVEARFIAIIPQRPLCRDYIASQAVLRLCVRAGRNRSPERFSARTVLPKLAGHGSPHMPFLTDLDECGF